MYTGTGGSRRADHLTDTSNKVPAPRTACGRRRPHGVPHDRPLPVHPRHLKPAVRRDVAAAVRDGIPWSISPRSSTSASAPCARTPRTQRTIRQLDPHERESVIHACRRGGRRRWERELGADAVRELLGER